VPFGVLNDRFVAGLASLVPAHRCFASVGAIFFKIYISQNSVATRFVYSAIFNEVFTATCFSNVAVMGSLDVRLSVCLSVTLVSSDHIH